MAEMYPERLPASILRNPKRSAERKVYNALSKLDNNFVVFYSVKWLARRPGRGAEDGEADFVIAHPDLGLLVVEVKGGGIACDARTGQWTSTDRHGRVHPLKKDPVEQARKSQHTLFRKLSDMPGWDSTRWLTIGSVVAFPDVVVENTTLRLDLPREIVLDATDLNDIKTAIQRAFNYYAREDGRTGELGHDRLRIVKNLLARSIHLRTPLGVELDHEDEQLIDLTERQLMLIDFLRDRRRAAVKGCAGSGKTMLAIEKARRLADQGFDVLLVCFNRPLAEDLQGRISKVGKESASRITVTHFHGLCNQMAEKAGVVAGDPVSRLLEAIDRLGPQFDAVIVDEGQDFQADWWLPLEALLRDSKFSIFYIFYDDNQNLYGNQEQIPGIVDEAPFPLLENCRNAQPIHRIVTSFYHAPEALRCRGPAGEPPQIQTYRGDTHLVRVLSRVLHRLIVEEKVKEQDVVVLTPRSQDRTALKPGKKVGQFTLTADRPKKNQIKVALHRFVG